MHWPIAYGTDTHSIYCREIKREVRVNGSYIFSL